LARWILKTLMFSIICFYLILFSLLFCMIKAQKFKTRLKYD
jgi:hypothetical protein